MQFVYEERAGEPVLVLEGEVFTHLFKARRTRSDTPLHVRNLKDGMEYVYSLGEVGKKSAKAYLQEQKPLLAPRGFSLVAGWALVEQKTIEKALPMLNEMGVGKIAFVQSDFSQGNIKLDFSRLKRILIHSCQQCGRGDLMEWEQFDSVEAWLKAYPQGVVVDFSPHTLDGVRPAAFLVGCEGGFSPREKALFTHQRVVGLDSAYILRSESAVVAMAAKILL